MFALIINVLREFFQRWGVPEEISMDGAPNYMSQKITTWLTSWGVTHTRVSSAYYPQSNGRAEVAVKSLKRLIEGNTGPRGSINNDDIAKALMQYRNTPHRDGSGSPAELAIGRCIRDTLPLHQHRYKINPNWARNLHERELSMNKQNQALKQLYDKGSKCLKPLSVGDEVLSQNMRTKKWDKSGRIIEVKGFRQYLMKMNGSGRLSLRNRRHLQKLNSMSIKTAEIQHPVHCSEDYPTQNRDQDEDSSQQRNDIDQQIEGPQLGEMQSNDIQVPRRSTRIRKPVQRYVEQC